MFFAKWIDQALLRQEFVNGIWHVHSVFKQSLNLQDQSKQQLLMITAQELHFPKGIVVAPTDYLLMAKELSAETVIMIQQRVIHFPKHSLSFQESVHSDTHWQAEANAFDPQAFWSTLASVTKMTGYHEMLNQVTSSQQSFCLAIDQLCDLSFRRQRQGVSYLLGRGIGLTPTGDDMLVGHLFARLVMDRKDLRLTTYLDRKLKSLHDLTTDVSRHYLINALEESFNQTTLSLVESLTREEYQSVIKRILELGHTSGADFLAGFARSIHCFQQKRNEE
jgi:hypothetical protein